MKTKIQNSNRTITFTAKAFLTLFIWGVFSNDALATSVSESTLNQADYLTRSRTKRSLDQIAKRRRIYPQIQRVEDLRMSDAEAYLKFKENIDIPFDDFKAYREFQKAAILSGQTENKLNNKWEPKNARNAKFEGTYAFSLNCVSRDMTGVNFGNMSAWNVNLSLAQLQGANLAAFVRSNTVVLTGAQFDLNTQFENGPYKNVKMGRLSDGIKRGMYFVPGRPWTNEEFEVAVRNLREIGQTNASGFVEPRHFSHADLTGIDPHEIIKVFGNRLNGKHLFYSYSGEGLDSKLPLLPESIKVNQSAMSSGFEYTELWI